MEITLYKNHGTGASSSIGTWKISVTDNSELKISHARIFGGQEVTRIIQVEGKNIGKKNETTPYEQAHKEMESRIKKQKDKGYVENLECAQEDAVNSLGFEPPVLATVFEKVKPENIDWDSAYLQPKLNGNRCLYKDGKLYSRRGKEIHLPHLVEGILNVGLGEYHLDGEIYVHGMPLQKINSLIKKPTEESEVLEFHIYDVVDKNLPFWDRFVCEFEAGIYGKIVIVETVRCPNEEILHNVTASYVESGYEGSMLRFGNQGYEVGKRSRKLLKVKSYKDTEAKVVGYAERSPNTLVERSTGIEKTLANFVWVCQNPFNPVTTFDVTPQGTWEEVDKEWLTREEGVGKILTFKYFELSEDKIPQQPIMLSWRE